MSSLVLPWELDWRWAIMFAFLVCLLVGAGRKRVRFDVGRLGLGTVCIWYELAGASRTYSIEIYSDVSVDVVRVGEP